ncbi:MAG: oxidoreductase, partial [candidate division Zixibacteria bacterium]|nr:oxidoreductase [candidate division Zixibacteria bacterium]
MTSATQNILIVGGRSGIGRAVLDRLLESNCQIWCASRQQPDDVDEKRVTFVPLDVTSDD